MPRVSNKFLPLQYSCLYDTKDVKLRARHLKRNWLVTCTEHGWKHQEGMSYDMCSTLLNLFSRFGSFILKTLKGCLSRTKNFDILAPRASIGCERTPLTCHFIQNSFWGILGGHQMSKMSNFHYFQHFFFWRLG